MPSDTPSARLVEWSIAWRWSLLALGVILAAVSWFPSRQLAFDREIENMFAADDPLIPPYRELKRIFGGNEIVIAAYVDSELMTQEGMERLAQVSEQLSQVPGVGAVFSLRSPMGDAIIEPDNRLAASFRELFEGYTHGADGKTCAAICLLAPLSETDAPRTSTIRGLREVVESLPHGTIAGEPVMVIDGFRYVEEDGRLLGLTSTLLLVGTIALCFRSLRWVLVPIAVVQLTLLVTRALLVGLQFRLSMVSSMLTAIVTVVGVATVIHVIVRFRDARASGLAPREALRVTGAILAVPIFWACATDAVGFGSLLLARVGPVQDFGLMMATGSLLVIVSVALLIPGLALWGRWDVDPQRAWGEARLAGGLRQLLDWVEHRPKSVAGIGLVLAVAAISGSFRLEVETDFTKNFRAKSPIVRSYQFVESNLGGAGVWDVILPPTERLDWDYLKRVLKLERRLRTEVPGLTKVVSLASAVEAGQLVTIDNLRFTVAKDAAVHAIITRMRSQMPTFVGALVGADPDLPDHVRLRIMLRARERQPSAEKRALIEAVDRISREEFPGAQVTGIFVLLTHLIDSMIRDQWITFAAASAGIGLMMLAAFGSLRLALVALVPNALPIVIVTGLMGWLGLKINMGAAMIAAVSLGLSVDASIHYIFAFRRAQREGLSPAAALDAVQQSVGRALVFATLALVVGFSALCRSEFVPTIYFGALVSLTMLGGLAGNLIILPLLLKLVTPK